MNVVVKKLQYLKALLKESFGVKNIYLFGSYARGEADEKSDIDIMVEFEEGKETFRNYMALKEFLEKELRKPVDLVVKDALKTHLRKAIEKEVISV